MWLWALSFSLFRNRAWLLTLFSFGAWDIEALIQILMFLGFMGQARAVCSLMSLISGAPSPREPPRTLASP